MGYSEDDYHLTLIRRDADDLLKRFPEYDIAIHWCMLLSVYPVFADICKLIERVAARNKISLFEDDEDEEIDDETVEEEFFDEPVASAPKIGFFTKLFA